MAEIDHQIAAISEGFDLVLHVTPVNAGAAFDDFRGSGYDTAPEFLYRARTLDPGLEKRALFAVPLERIEDPAIAHIFLEKREELDRKLTLIDDRGTSRFLLGSRAVYGEPDDELVALAERILDRLPPSVKASPAPIDDVVAATTRELDHYRSLDPSLRSEIQVRTDIPGVMVSQGNLLIGARAHVDPGRIEALIAHEVGTHVLTHHNGRQQPFRELYVGTAGYEALQEGLAVLWEHLVGGLDGGRLRLLGGRVVAARALCDGAEFTETWRLLRDTWGFSASAAFTVAMRVHRGGGLTKDAVYLKGLVQVLDYLGRDGPFERLHIGKVSHEHLGVAEELEWRKILAPPRLLPRALARTDVQDRLEACQRGLTVDDLVEMC